MKSENDLTKNGFTESGKSRFNQTISDYTEELFTKASHYGKIDQAKDLPIEITHEHVRQAAYSIANSFGKDRPSKWAVAGNIGEYIFTALAGIGGGNMNESWGQLTFGISLALVVILIVFRLFRTK